MTKVEGAVGVLLILIGVAVRDHLERRPDRLRRLVPLLAAPLLGVAVWLTFQATHGLRIGYRTHGELLSLHFRFLGSVLSGMLAHVDAGTLWLSWLIPLAFVAIRRPRNPTELAPALSLTAGLLLFFLFDYLHDATDPSIRIVWTLPRVSQPALSALILAAGMTADPRSPAERSKASRGGNGAPGRRSADMVEGKR